MDIHRFFEPAPGKKPIEIVWHDYEDGCSHDKTIYVPCDQDAEAGAYSFLSEYIPGKYELELAKEAKGTWRIEVGPVFEGAGPGDGSDAPFDIISFEGTWSEAKTKADESVSHWQAHFGGYHPDLGHFGVGYSIT